MRPAPCVRIAIGIAAMAGIAGVGLLGLAWQVDRGRAWETPRWNPSEFVALSPAASDARHELWLVSVHPGCGHCRSELDRHARAPQGGIRIAALVVDTPRRPSASFVATLPVAEAWWDHRNIWRRRWGHRLYGDLMRFDSTGRYLGPTGDDTIAERR
jgi:hypothetical protein